MTTTDKLYTLFDKLLFVKRLESCINYHALTNRIVIMFMVIHLPPCGEDGKGRIIAYIYDLM